MRRSIWPVRELVSGLLRSEAELITEDTRVYLRDVYDHAVQAIDAAETLRELTTSLMDLYLSTVGQRTNDVMRVLCSSTPTPEPGTAPRPWAPERPR